MNARRPHLLLTNDDGADSPLFALLIELLAPYGDLTIAVPAREQSWQGKSMTRHGSVRCSELTIADHQAFAIDGTPADCVNIALYNLLPELAASTKPDLVISGINVGQNAGLSLVWASGTVGACLEGNIAGVPGIALSQRLSRAAYSYWDSHRSFDPETYDRLRDATHSVMPVIWQELATASAPVTYNVNLPWELADAQLEHSYLGHSWYQQCFVPHDDHSADDAVYQHRMQPFEFDDHPQADINVLERGRVSVSTLDMRSFGRLASPQRPAG